MSMSLDGFVAGPDQGPDDPIGVGGLRTTFFFVKDGFDAALEQAKAAARTGDVDIAGGASTVRQALTAGAIDELTLVIVPVILGRGERLFDGVEDPGLQPIEAVHSPHATHVRYRITRR
jgi:dihydrofolate reductase